MPPDELSVEMACLGVHLDADRFDIDAAFEHVKLRACDEGIDGAAVAADPARNLCVPHSRGIASPGEDAASLFLADRFDELLAQFARAAACMSTMRFWSSQIRPSSDEKRIRLRRSLFSGYLMSVTSPPGLRFERLCLSLRPPTRSFPRVLLPQICTVGEPLRGRRVTDRAQNRRRCDEVRISRSRGRGLQIEFSELSYQISRF